MSRKKIFDLKEEDRKEEVGGRDAGRKGGRENVGRKYELSIGEIDHESIYGSCLSGGGQTSFTVVLKNEKVYWL